MKKILFIIIFFFFSGIAAFADTSIKAEVDKLKVSTDETLIYTVTVASTDKELSPPRIPSFDGFNLLSQAESSSISFEKKALKTTLIYKFVLAPIDAGKFQIDSSSIKIKNKILSTDSFQIEVIQGKIKPQVPPEHKPSLPEQGEPETKEPQVTL